MGHARKERVVLIGTDQRITSGPAARTAAFKGRIHGCTRTLSKKVRFFSLAPRAPSIHDPTGDIANAAASRDGDRSIAAAGQGLGRSSVPCFKARAEGTVT